MPNAVEPRTESPTSLAAAHALLADADGAPWKPLAGGTDLMVQLAGEIGEAPERIIDIWALDELRGIAVEADALVIGALTTYTEIRRSPDVARLAPVLADAAATIGAAQIHNRGTLGGNAVNASPAGDTLPVLLALDAELVLGSTTGERTVPAGAFWSGYRTTMRRDDELLLRVRVPIVDGRDVRFRKVGTRRAQAISKVVMTLASRPGRGGTQYAHRLTSCRTSRIFAPATERLRLLDPAIRRSSLGTRVSQAHAEMSSGLTLSIPTQGSRRPIHHAGTVARPR